MSEGHARKPKAPDGLAHDVTIDGHAFSFWDAAGSRTVQFVTDDLARDVYGLRALTLAPGNAVVDIGANVGIISILLARRFPSAQIIAYEPVPLTVRHLQRNLVANAVMNVAAMNLAVTGDGRPVTLRVPPDNSGGATILPAVRPEAVAVETPVASLTLDHVFELHGVHRCRLLKLDVEGAEYEILEAAKCLDRVQTLILEPHELCCGQSAKKLLKMLASRWPKLHVVATSTMHY